MNVEAAKDLVLNSARYVSIMMYTYSFSPFLR